MLIVQPPTFLPCLPGATFLFVEELDVALGLLPGLIELPGGFTAVQSFASLGYPLRVCRRCIRSLVQLLLEFLPFSVDLIQKLAVFGELFRADLRRRFKRFLQCVRSLLRAGQVHAVQRLTLGCDIVGMMAHLVGLLLQFRLTVIDRLGYVASRSRLSGLFAHSGSPCIGFHLSNRNGSGGWRRDSSGNLLVNSLTEC